MSARPRPPDNPKPRAHETSEHRQPNRARLRRRSGLRPLLGAVAIDGLDRAGSAAEDMRAHWLPQTRELGNMLFLAQRFRVIEAAFADGAAGRPAGGGQDDRRDRGQIEKKSRSRRGSPATTAKARRSATSSSCGGHTWSSTRVSSKPPSRGAGGEAAALYRSEMREAIHVCRNVSKAVADNVAGRRRGRRSADGA